MKTLKVTLKQHTPLIHFQHNQYGATLRASEVKPKLDKFIVSRAFDDKYEKCKYYLVGYKFSTKKSETERRIDEANLNKRLKQKFDSSNYRALNYKLKISSNIVDEYLIASYLSDRDKAELRRLDIKYLENTPYFAQEKQNKEIVSTQDVAFWNNIGSKGVILDNIILTVSSHNDMIGIIAQNIQAFFLYENFGNRQNKGFGCFEVTGIFLGEGERTQELQANEYLLRQNFLFCYKKNLQSNDLNTIFSTINNDYKLLKSGRNRPYAKSKLMLYFLREVDKYGYRMRWEKAFFKDNVDDRYKKDDYDKYHLQSNRNVDTQYEENDRFYYIRALLGVANQYEFLLQNPPGPNKKLVIAVDGDDSGVERFKSPIIFKVLNGCIYLAGNQISPDILNKKFKYYVTIQSDILWKNDPIESPLRTPSTFDLMSFLQWAMRDRTNNARLGYELL